MQPGRNFRSLVLAVSMVAAPQPYAQEASVTRQPAPPVRAPSEEFIFDSAGHKLHGCIIRPRGRGPFPAVIFNHGSEQNPAPCGPPALARMYLAHGFLFFSFQRHGHSPSPGEYIGDLQRQIVANTPQAEIGKRIVELHESYNLDVEGAVRWLMARSDVDPHRVVMTGTSFGGIQTLLTAEQGLGLRAFITFAPAAMSWGNVALRQRLLQAVNRSAAPIFLAQAANDFSTGPSELLGPIINTKEPPNLARLYPAFGATPREGHAGFAIFPGGIAIWRDDVLHFIDQAFRTK